MLTSASMTDPNTDVIQGTLDLLARWDAEDETSDSNEIAARQEELTECKRAMNKNRAESEGPASRRIFE